MLVKTQLAVDTIRVHLAQISLGSPETNLIKSYLAANCAVLFYGEMEDLVSKILQTRLTPTVSSRMATFIHASSEGILRRVKKADIADLVSKFGPIAKQEFEAAFTDQDVTRYSNVISKRHQNAHQPGGISVTLEEVETAIPIANRMLVELDQLVQRP